VQLLDPCRAFHLDINWLVCSAKNARDFLAALLRKAQQVHLGDEGHGGSWIGGYEKNHSEAFMEATWTNTRLSSISLSLINYQLGLHLVPLPEYSRSSNLNVHPFLAHPFVAIYPPALLRYGIMLSLL
jgi:hypothetical protein